MYPRVIGHNNTYTGFIPNVKFKIDCSMAQCFISPSIIKAVSKWT